MERPTAYKMEVYLEDDTNLSYENVHYKLDPSWLRIFQDTADGELVIIIPAESVKIIFGRRPLQDARPKLLARSS